MYKNIKLSKIVFILIIIVASIVFNLNMMYYFAHDVYGSKSQRNFSLGSIEGDCVHKMKALKNMIDDGKLNIDSAQVEIRTPKSEDFNKQSEKFQGLRLAKTCGLTDDSPYKILKLKNSDYIIYCPIHGFYNKEYLRVVTIEGKQKYFNNLCKDNGLNTNDYQPEFKDLNSYANKRLDNFEFNQIWPHYKVSSSIFILMLIIAIEVFTRLEYNFIHFFVVSYIINFIICSFAFNYMAVINDTITLTLLFMIVYNLRYFILKFYD